jgi:myo-inositol-1(or 4)-monophosphatase
MRPSSISTIMSAALQKVSRGIARDFSELTHLQSSPKGTADFLSKAEWRIEQRLIEVLLAMRPDYAIDARLNGFIADSESESTPEYVWLVNPLAGMSNFGRAIPFFAVVIALIRNLPNDQSEIIAATVHAPILGETFMAEKGQGAWTESNYTDIAGSKQRLRVSQCKDIHSAIATSPNRLLDAPENHRALGCDALALAYLAAGRADLYLHTTTSEHPAAHAAGLLLVQEAGGRVSTKQGDNATLDDGAWLASNALLHASLVEKWKANS